MRVKLQNVRLSFPDLFEAKKFPGQENAAPRYSATFLVEPGGENHKIIEAAIQSVTTEKFKTKAAALVAGWRTNSNKFCFVDGNTKEYDGYQGMLALASHRQQSDGRPMVLDANKTPLTIADGKPYAGCYVNAVVNIYAQVGQYAGVRCELLGVQFYRDGDAFTGAGRVSEEDFEDLAVTESEDALT